MVKVWIDGVNRYEPVEEIQAYVTLWGEKYGAAFMPNSWRDVNCGERISFKFDDIEELRTYRESIDRMVDSLEKILYNRSEESIELFKERVSSNNC